jgi:hypothetical protein
MTAIINDRCGSDWAENGAQAPGQMSDHQGEQ